MKYKDVDYLCYVPVVERPTVSLLLFPPASRLESGFYLIEPDGVGGNKFTLLQKEEFEARTRKAWFYSTTERASRVAAALEVGPVKDALAHGAVWSSAVAEELAAHAQEDEACRIP